MGRTLRTEAGLVREHVSGHEYGVRRERLRTFVDIQERPEAMPSAVL